MRWMKEFFPAADAMTRLRNRSVSIWKKEPRNYYSRDCRRKKRHTKPIGNLGTLLWSKSLAGSLAVADTRIRLAGWKAGGPTITA